MAHIKVNPADDDEVIVVGAAAQTQTQTQTQGASAQGAGFEAEIGARAGEGAGREPEGPSAEGAAPARRRGDARSPGERPGGRARAKGGAYRETTLEDLEPSPMPLAQRIVIVAAVVCIIGALVYYFVAMR